MLSANKTTYPLRHADNHFLKKSRMLTDLMKPIDQPDSLNTVFVIGGIFLFLTISITGAVAVFCRKRNTVFALQKSEQEDVDDIDYELDEFDDSSTEYEESECDISRPRLSSNGNHLDIHYNDSPVHFPLVAYKHDSYADDTFESQPSNKIQWADVESTLPSSYSPISNTTQSNGYPNYRGQYHQMVVTAVMENTNTSSTITTAVDTTEHSSSPLTEGNTIPSISIAFGDHPPSYDSIDHAKT